MVASVYIKDVVFLSLQNKHDLNIVWVKRYLFSLLHLAQNTSSM